MKKRQNRILVLLALLFVLNIPLLLGGNLISPSKDDNSAKVKENDDLLMTNDVGYDLWWNKSYQFRSLINITNPYPEKFDNFITKIEFNYSSLVGAGKMNSSLKDLRIVENGKLRNYYIQKDFQNAMVSLKSSSSISP